jgi:imidazoleglycerol-phosphate dehydratase
MKKRQATVKRKTKETDITVKLVIDGGGKSKINTGIGILDHMLELFAFHGLFDLDISAKGDLKVDIHHTNEDVGLVLGQAFKKALANKQGIRRFGSVSVPMEDAIATVVADISGRGFFKCVKGNTPIKSGNMQEYSIEDVNHFLEALAKNIGLNLDVTLSSSNLDLHTNLEPIFKALGIVLDQATQIDPRRKGIPSTKGRID